MDAMPDRSPCQVIDLGEIDLLKADSIITRLTEDRQRDAVTDMLLFLSYKPCLAVGVRQMNPQDLLKPLDFFTRQNIPLYKTVRGGGLTYHWPGQLVCYPILKLREDEKNIPKYMSILEQIGLDALAQFGLSASRKRDKTAQIGLWINNDKIASMGIRISRWVTSYGFALNLGGDPSPSFFIRPCGLEDVNLVTIEQKIGTAPERESVKSIIKSLFERYLNRHLLPEISRTELNLGEQGLFYEYGHKHPGA